jgi:hypothetical protein
MASELDVSGLAFPRWRFRAGVSELMFPNWMLLPYSF